MWIDLDFREVSYFPFIFHHHHQWRTRRKARPLLGSLVSFSVYVSVRCGAYSYSYSTDAEEFRHETRHLLLLTLMPLISLIRALLSEEITPSNPPFSCKFYCKYFSTSNEHQIIPWKKSPGAYSSVDARNRVRQTWLLSFSLWHLSWRQRIKLNRLSELRQVVLRWEGLDLSRGGFYRVAGLGLSGRIARRDWAPIAV